MIDEDRTIQLFGYTSDELAPKSNKKIVAVCEGCGTCRVLAKQKYKDLCHSCVMGSIETRRKMSEAAKGKTVTVETCSKMSEAHKKRHASRTPEQRIVIGKKISKSLKILPPFSEETRQKMSCAKQGITINEWGGFVGRHATRLHALDDTQCIKLNTMFVGCEGHHLSRSIIAYIPKTLHKHIRHSLKTGYRMDAINALALQYVYSGVIH